MMVNNEELKKVMESGMKNKKYVKLEVSPGIWIDADEFQETENGILFAREGHSSGFVHKDIFKTITWEQIRKKINEKVK